MKVESLRTPVTSPVANTTDSAFENTAPGLIRVKRTNQAITQENKKLATELIRSGDATLAYQLNAALMEQILASPTDGEAKPAGKSVSNIPPLSTFGMAWSQLTQAIQSEPFATFARVHKIEPGTLRLNTRDGWTLDCIADGKPASFSQYTPGWWKATAAVTEAARALTPTLKLDVEYTGATSAPAEVIGDFYAARNNGTQADKLYLIALQNQHGSFDALREPDSTAPAFNRPTHLPVRQQQEKAIEALSAKVAADPQRFSLAAPNPKSSVEEADLALARLYGRAALSLRPEMGRLGNAPRATLSVSEIPEHSTLGQTLRNSTQPRGKDTRLTLDWIGRFYGEPASDGTLEGALKHTSSLTRQGFHALSKADPPTDKRSVAVRRRQDAAIQRLANPVLPTDKPAQAINPMADLARSQFSREPTLHSVTSQLVSDRIKAIAPGLDVDANQIAIATPDPQHPGQFKKTQLMTLVMDYLAGGPAPDFTNGHRAFDTRPNLLEHTGNDTGVPLSLDLPALSAALRALPTQLNEALTVDSQAYWNKPAFSTPTANGTAFPGSHRDLVSSILRSNLQQAGLKQPGLDDEQRKTVAMVTMRPNGSTRALPLDPTNSGADVYAAPGPIPNILIHRYLSQPHREILLLVEPSGKITAYNAWDDLPYARRNLTIQNGNTFDAQADALIKQHQGNSLSAAPPLYDDKSKTKLPDWMSKAGDAQRFVFHELSLELANFLLLNKGQTYNSDIKDIRTFAEEKFDRLPKKNKLTRYAANQLEVVFKVPYGAPMTAGFIDRQSMSLTDMMLKNLSGLPNGQIEVFAKTGLKENGVDIKVRVPQLEKEGVLKQMIDDLDIGKTYPALLKQKLLDEPVKTAERQALFAQQVPIELQMKALELSIKGTAGVTTTGFRFIQEILKPGPAPRMVDGKEIVIRPLAFDNTANGKIDVVEGAYLIEPKDSATGPHILYRPLIADAPLMQFPSRQALLEAIQKRGKLQTDTLAWLPDESTRQLYRGNGFTHPNVVLFGYNLGSTSLNTTIPLAVDDRLQQALHDGKLIEYLYTANAQNLITLAKQQSTSDAESRWASLKEGGFLLLNALLPAMRGPGATLGVLLQADGILNDVHVLSADDVKNKEAALTDLLVNLASLLIHFKVRSSSERALGGSTRAPHSTSMLIDEVATTAAPAKNRIVLGGPVDIKPLSGDIQVFVDTYKGEQRLNIMGHGEEPSGDGASRILGEDNKSYAAEDINQELLARGIDIRNYSEVRLLSCYSSSGGDQSLAAQLQTLTGVRVKGFRKEIIVDYKGVDGEDPFLIYEDASTRYRQQYPALSDSDIHLLAEKELNRKLAGRDLDFNINKDNGTEIEINIGSDEKPVLYRTRVDYQPRTFGSPKTKTAPVKPIEVLMGYSHTIENSTSALSTRSLTDCSALAVLTDLKDGVYQKRTLMHLTGSNLEFGLFDANAAQAVDELEKSLAKGGKVIFVGGVDSQSPVGMGVVLGQEVQGRKPLLDILKKPGVETIIASSLGVDINPDGTYKLIEGTGKGTFTQPMIKNVFDFAE